MIAVKPILANNMPEKNITTINMAINIAIKQPNFSINSSP